MMLTMSMNADSDDDNDDDDNDDDDDDDENVPYVSIAKICLHCSVLFFDVLRQGTFSWLMDQIFYSHGPCHHRVVLAGCFLLFVPYIALALSPFRCFSGTVNDITGEVEGGYRMENLPAQHCFTKGWLIAAVVIIPLSAMVLGAIVAIAYATVCKMRACKCCTDMVRNQGIFFSNFPRSSLFAAVHVSYLVAGVLCATLNFTASFPTGFAQTVLFFLATLFYVAYLFRGKGCSEYNARITLFVQLLLILVTVAPSMMAIALNPRAPGLFF
jgi:hypothetical protein